MLCVCFVVAGERETLCGAETHPCSAARSGGSRKTAGLSANSPGEDQTTEGALKTSFLVSSV